MDRSTPEKSFLNALLSPTAKELLHKSSKLSVDSGRTVSPAPYRKDSSSSGTAKLKAWFRKKLRFEIPDASNEARIVLPGEQSPRSVQPSPVQKQERVPSPAEDAFRIARQIIRTAGKDLSCIEGCMDDVRVSAIRMRGELTLRLLGRGILVVSRQSAFPDGTTIQSDHGRE